MYGRPVLLFQSEWALKNVIVAVGEQLQLKPYALAPDIKDQRRKKK